jgi:hypothetical protein
MLEFQYDSTAGNADEDENEDEDEVGTAIQFCCAAAFHRSFTLPATTAHAPLRVTYSFAGLDLSVDCPTMIWASGMFGTRYQAFNLHNLAERMGVRLVFIDRYATHPSPQEWHINC